jgi:putative PIN family toxin of toxin-antitoxin system
MSFQKFDSPIPLVIVDTSVFISALLSKNPNSAPCQIIIFWREGKFNLVISPQILEELVEKLLAKNIDKTDIKDILTAIFYTAIKIQGTYEATILDNIDPNDNMFLAAAYEVSADYLVSLDKKHTTTNTIYNKQQSADLFDRLMLDNNIQLKSLEELEKLDIVQMRPLVEKRIKQVFGSDIVMEPGLIELISKILSFFIRTI